MSASQAFYAIARGHTIGVVRTWNECQARTKGFSRAAFKKFGSLGEAEAFISSYSASSLSGAKRSLESSGTDTQKRAHKAGVVVYCDGASKGNGQTHAVAGSACYFEHDWKAREIVARTPGRQTNSRAELFGAALALHATLSIEPVRLCTDSDYVIQGVAQLDTYRQDGWRLAGKKKLANSDLWRLLSALVEKRAAQGLTRVDFQHVLAHSGIAGNERADKLAGEGTARDHLSRDQLARLFPMIDTFDWSLIV